MYKRTDMFNEVNVTGVIRFIAKFICHYIYIVFTIHSVTLITNTFKDYILAVSGEWDILISFLHTYNFVNFSTNGHLQEKFTI